MSRFFWSTDNTRQTGNPDIGVRGDFRGTGVHLGHLSPCHAPGLAGRAERSLPDPTVRNHASAGLVHLLVCPRQGVWKLLPGNFTTDLFVADASLGAIPIDLSRAMRGHRTPVV